MPHQPPSISQGLDPGAAYTLHFVSSQAVDLARSFVFRCTSTPAYTPHVSRVGLGRPPLRIRDAITTGRNPSDVADAEL
jgi:hypothetical protein